jgi:hypothetical protein
MNTAKSVMTGYGSYNIGDYVGYAKISRIDVNVLGSCVNCSLFITLNGSEELFMSIFSNDVQIIYERAE